MTPSLSTRRTFSSATLEAIDERRTGQTHTYPYRARVSGVTGLSLTEPQMRKLLGLPHELCEAAIGELVRHNFLVATPRGNLPPKYPFVARRGFTGARP